MSSSLVDFEGPITVLTLAEVEEEHADEIAQYLADDMVHIQAEIARNNGLLSCEMVRQGTKFATWQRYQNAKAAERVFTTRYMHFRRLKLSDYVPEPPTVLFFPTASMPAPSDKASTKGPPDYELKD